MIELAKGYKYGCWIIEKDGKVSEVSDSFLLLTGYDREEVLNNHMEVVWTELLRADRSLNSLSSGDKVILFSKSLDVRFISVEWTSIGCEEILYSIMEEENSRLECKNPFLNRLIEDDRTGVGIYSVQDFTLIKANQTYLSYLPSPYNSKEMAYGKRLKDIIPNFEVSNGEKAWKSIVEKNQSLYLVEKQGLLLNKDECYWDNDIIPVTENGEVKYVVSMLDNVTERVLGREHLRVKNEQLEAILESASDTIQIVDYEGNYVMKSSYMGKSAMPHSEFGMKSLNKFLDIYDKNGSVMQFEDLPAGRVLSGEIVMGRQLIVEFNGRRKYFNVSGKPILDKEGKVIYGVLITHDVTERVEKEKKINLQQELLLKVEKEKREVLENALAMKDEFLSLISHEFKTPLNVIYSAVQLIEYVYMNKLPDSVKDLVKSIKQNTFRQLRLVNNLLDITRINSGKLKLNMRSIDIVLATEAITKSVKFYASQKNIELEFITNLSSKMISIDDEKYERVILNLLSNAIKFTPAGGRIKVQVEEDIKSSMIKILVIDTGIGIPTDKQELIFERFGQVDSNLSRQAEGTGIGLSLVKLIVDALGGTIKLESELGTGSIFIITLPVKKVTDIEEKETCLDFDSRLVNSIKVEFSDIYF
jgi:signal transduction histidine kinase